MSQVKSVDGVRAICPDPVLETGTLKEQAGCLVVGQQWESLAVAPHLSTELSGPFNNMDTDLTSGISTVDSGIDSHQLTMDPTATSAVDLAELFPDLTDLLADPAQGVGEEKEEEGPSTAVTEGGSEVLGQFLIPAASSTPKEAKSDVVVIDAGRREQLPSTSSCASGSEMSDYEDGLSPAEVDSALEHFFNEFIDLSSMVENPAGDTGPTATVDVATVRSLIDNTTNENGSSLSDLLNVGNDSLACSTGNVSSKRVKLEENEAEEEVNCHVSKKPRVTKKRAKAPEDAYRMRRIKNNLACKRARQNRKKREAGLAETAQALEAENALLRAKIEELTEIAALSRKALVGVFAQ